MDLSGEKVLLTGGTGLIGVPVARLLRAAGAHVRVLVRENTDVSEIAPLEVELAVGDVRDPDSLDAAVEGVDWVIHMAVNRHKGTKHRAGDPEVTLQGTLNMARAAASRGVKGFVQASSSGVVGANHAGLISETTVPKPNRAYRVLRLQAEQELSQIAAETGLPVTIARITHVFGPRDTQLAHLFRLIARKEMVLFGDGAQTHHLSYVDDVASGLIACLGAASDKAPVYLIGSPPRPLWTFISEIVRATDGHAERRSWMTPILRPVAQLYSALGRPLEARTGLGRKFDFHVTPWHCDISKAQRELDLPDPVPLQLAVERTAAWYRDNGHL